MIGVKWGDVVRYADVSGVSGTGVIAQIVVFGGGGGPVVVYWFGEHPCVQIWAGTVEDFLAVHGHGGKTVIRWDDLEVEGATSAETAHCLAMTP